MPYRILVTDEAKRHLRSLRPRDQRVVADAIGAQLAHQPGSPTRNRFPMRAKPAAAATWELRVGAFRVFYDIEETPDPVVRVRAVGEKRGNALYVEGREVTRYD